MNPTLSVVIPTFNSASFLTPLLHHLRGAAPDAEIIVVDDGSTDDTAVVAREFEGEIVYLRQANHGPAAARNAGLQHAHAPVVAFLDADDEWEEEHPEAALTLLRESEWEIVLGQTQCLTKTNGASFAPHAEPFHTFNLGSALISRDVFRRVGAFNESLRFGEDLDWFLRAREAGVRMAFLDWTTLRYRLHERNVSGTAGAPTSGMLNALHLSILRRAQSHPELAAIPRISV